MEYIAITIFVLFIILVFSILFILPIFIGYKLWNKSKYSKYLVLTILIGYSLLWYDTLYPNDKFYIEHIENITKIKFSKDITVIEKYAGFPDHFRDYPACATFKINQTDMRKIQSLIKNKYKIIENSELNSTCVKDSKYDFIFSSSKAGENIYWGYNISSQEVFFDYYSY